MLLLSGCSSLAGGLGRHDSATSVPAGGGILSQLRPKVDPRFVEKAKRDEMERMSAQMAQAEAMRAQAQSQASADGSGRVLPHVSMDPISSQQAVAANMGIPSSVDTSGAFPPAAAATPGNSSAADPAWNGSNGAANFGSGTGEAQPMAAPTLVADARKPASYGAYSSTVPPPPPGSLSGGSMTPASTGGDTVYSGQHAGCGSRTV